MHTEEEPVTTTRIDRILAAVAERHTLVPSVPLHN